MSQITENYDEKLENEDEQTARTNPQDQQQQINPTPLSIPHSAPQQRDSLLPSSQNTEYIEHTRHGLCYESRVLSAIIAALRFDNEAAVRAQIEALRLDILQSAKSVFEHAAFAAHAGLSLDLPAPRRLSNIVLLAALAKLKITFTGRLEFLNEYGFGPRHLVYVCSDTVLVRVENETQLPASLLPVREAKRLIERSRVSAVFTYDNWHSLSSWTFGKFPVGNERTAIAFTSSFLTAPSAPPTLRAFDIDGISGAVDLESVEVFKNPLVLRAEASEATRRIQTKARVLVAGADNVASVTGRAALPLGSVITELGELRVLYVFGDADASVPRKKTVIQHLAQTIQEWRDRNGLWNAAHASMRPKDSSASVLEAVVPAEIIASLFAELRRRMGRPAETACLYVECYGCKTRTRCTTRADLLRKLDRAVDLARFPDCAVDICCSAGYDGDRATFLSAKVTNLFPRKYVYTLFLCSSLRNVHAYTQHALRNKLIMTCPPLQKINFYNVIEDQISRLCKEKFYPLITGFMMKAQLLGAAEAARRLEQEFAALEAAAEAIEVAQGLPVRLEVRVQASAVWDALTWLEDVAGDAASFLTCETQVVAASLRENLRVMLGTLARYAQNGDMVRAVAMETFFREMFLKGSANYHMAPRQTLEKMRELSSSTCLPEIPAGLFDAMHVTPRMQENTCAALIRHFPNINEVTENKLRLISMCMHLHTDQKRTTAVERILTVYEAEFAAYYQVEVSTLAWLSPSAMRLLGPRVTTLGALLDSAFGPRTTDACLERMTFRRCLFAALPYFDNHMELRTALAAALCRRQWNYCFTIPAGGLSRRRGPRFNQLVLDEAAVLPMINVPDCPDGLSWLLIRNDVRTTGQHVTVRDEGRARTRPRLEWDAQESTRFLNALLLEKQNPLFSAVVVQRSFLYGWCFTRRSWTLRTKRKSLLRNPGLVELLLPSALSWTPAEFTEADRLRYYARFGVRLSPTQRESLSAAVQSEAATWTPPSRDDALNLIADDVITDSEPVRVRLVEVVDRVFRDSVFRSDNDGSNVGALDQEPEFTTHDVLLGDYEDNDEPGSAYTAHEDIAHEEVAHEDTVHEEVAHEDTVHEEVAHENPPTADADAPSLSQPIQIAMALPDTSLIRKLRQHYPSRAFTVGMIRKRLYSGSNRPTISLVQTQLQRLVATGVITLEPQRGRRRQTVQTERLKYTLVTHSEENADR
jgi:hypothetical protein